MLLGVLLSLIAIFLILLILVQRGRGGGLAGALGGMGGSSAFGAKAGDVLTRITTGAAFVWIVLCIIAAKWGASTDSRLAVQGPATGGTGGPPGASAGLDAAPAKDGDAATEATPATETPAASTPAESTPAGEGAAAPGDANAEAATPTPPTSEP